MGLLSLLRFSGAPGPALLGAGATTIHTASATAGVQDKLTLKVSNVSGDDATLSLTVNGVAILTDWLVVKNSLAWTVLDRMLMEDGAVLVATPSAASQLSIQGDVIRITP
jgi:hypothetical protein